MLDYDWRPSGESFEEVKMRVLKFLEKIKKENNDKEVLIVAQSSFLGVKFVHEFRRF